MNGRSDASTSTDDVKGRPLCLFYFSQPLGVVAAEPPRAAPCPAYLYQPAGFAPYTPSPPPPPPPAHMAPAWDSLWAPAPLSSPSAYVSGSSSPRPPPQRRDTLSSSLFSSEAWFPSSASSRCEYPRRVLPYHALLPPLRLPTPLPRSLAPGSPDEPADVAWPLRVQPERFSLPPIELPRLCEPDGDECSEPPRPDSVAAWELAPGPSAAPASSRQSRRTTAARRRLRVPPGVHKPRRRARASAVRRSLTYLIQRSIKEHKMSHKSGITSRKATTRQLEMQLKAVHKDLQASKAFCDQLLQERDDSEVELQKIINTNTALKLELGEMDLKLEETTGEKLRLEKLVDSFNQCASTHEVALKRIKNLEEELGATIEELNYLRKEYVKHNPPSTKNIYQEIVGVESTKDCKKYVFFNSSTKLKRYVKINRYIRRTQKLIKSQSVSKKYFKQKLELSVMKDRVKQCNIQLDNYDLDIQKLHAEISRLQSKLEMTTLMYRSSEREIKEHILAFDQLLKESKCNEERFNSLINSSNYCNCSHIPPTSSITGQEAEVPLGIFESALPVPNVQSPTHVSRTVVYSDQIGSGMGSMLGNKLGQNVSNFCYPNISLSQFCECLSKGSFDDRTTLVIMVGNSHNVDKASIDKLMSTINVIETSGIGKIIMCAIPYSQNMPYYYNNRIAHINSIMYNAICFNKKMHFFDINKFIKGFKLTSEKIIMPKKCIHTLVDLLAFNIY